MIKYREKEREKERGQMLHELVTIDHAWVLRCRQSHSMSSTCSSVLDEFQVNTHLTWKGLLGPWMGRGRTSRVRSYTSLRLEGKVNGTWKLKGTWRGGDEQTRELQRERSLQKAESVTGGGII